MDFHEISSIVGVLLTLPVPEDISGARGMVQPTQLTHSKPLQQKILF
jgi:hypothetical protein